MIARASTSDVGFRISDYLPIDKQIRNPLDPRSDIVSV